MPPTQRALPRVTINGAASREVDRNLNALCVHVVAGQASAELYLVNPLDEVAVNLADIESNRLEIALLADEVFFSGHLTALETRISPNSAPRTILFATGTAPDGASLPAIPLRFGAEMESGSVHRTAQAWTVHGVCGALELRLNSQIDVTTHDPAFDGQFRVSELWHRFDASGGGTVELIAER